MVCIVGKSWTLHVTKILGTTLEENLAMIADSVAFLKRRGARWSTTASTSSTASAPTATTRWRRSRRPPTPAPTGSRCATPTAAACRATSPRWSAWCKKTVPTPLGIHTHNDSDVAVANALAGVEAGCTQVQGTINGWGERCGNANLISIIPALQLKMGRRCVPDENLARLTELSRAVSEIANIRPRAHAPYVGALGVRAQGRRCTSPRSRRSPPATSTSSPERVGNRRHIVVSELSGRGNVRMRASELGVDVQGNERALLERIKELESQGYQFEAAEGSFELLGRRSAAGLRRRRSRCSTWSSSPSGGAATRCSPRRPSS